MYNSKPDVIKELYAALLTACAEFARNDLNFDSILSFLNSECSFPPNRAKTLFDQYEANKQEVQIRLGEIGSHPPHITDVEWKIDYVIKVHDRDLLKKLGMFQIFGYVCSRVLPISCRDQFFEYHSSQRYTTNKRVRKR